MLNCSSLVLESWAKASKSSYKRRARDLWGAAPLGTCTAHPYTHRSAACVLRNKCVRTTQCYWGGGCFVSVGYHFRRFVVCNVSVFFFGWFVLPIHFGTCCLTADCCVIPGGSRTGFEPRPMCLLHRALTVFLSLLPSPEIRDGELGRSLIGLTMLHFMRGKHEGKY